MPVPTIGMVVTIELVVRRRDTETRPIWIVRACRRSLRRPTRRSRPPMLHRLPSILQLPSHAPNAPYCLWIQLAYVCSKSSSGLQLTKC